ncbi:unnamed protein product [Heligmosomoides polygyrus]|uniref:ANF_receptor domain-containing protein n=1 Tax=Heligmosomoides polygyrus TaxID=6339 RepID=A0A183FKX3_HELPZ|nr:unnamed protein product [Heligmosomoides polygyrus]
MKIIERILHREIVKLSDNQRGFVSVCMTIDVMHAARLLVEKHREKQKLVHIAFLDRVPSGVCEAHHVAGFPSFRQLGPRDNVCDLRTSAKLGTPEAYSHMRESCHSKHRYLDSTLRVGGRVFILLSYSPGL